MFICVDMFVFKKLVFLMLMFVFGVIVFVVEGGYEKVELFKGFFGFLIINSIFYSVLIMVVIIVFVCMFVVMFKIVLICG